MSFPRGAIPAPRARASYTRAVMSAPSPAPPKFGSDAVTNGIRIQVSPRFVPETSDPAGGRYNFEYHVTITNEGAEAVTLRHRHWRIVDGDGEAHEVEGEGVVGKQPTIEPGARFEYQSFAPLMTHWGTMEGAFTFERVDRSAFDARVARFFLVGAEPRQRRK